MSTIRPGFPLRFGRPVDHNRRQSRSIDQEHIIGGVDEAKGYPPEGFEGSEEAGSARSVDARRTVTAGQSGRPNQADQKVTPIRDLTAAVEALRSELGATAPRRAVRHASTVAGLLSLVRRALDHTHLVHVAAVLTRELHLGLDELRALRFPVDLLETFPCWRSGSTAAFQPPSRRLTLAPESADRRIPALRVHVAPYTGVTPIVLSLLGDLDRRLDPSTRVTALVDSDSRPVEIRRLARGAVGTSRRVRFVGVDFGTIFARDNAMAAEDARARPVLIVPRMLRTPLDADARPLDVRATERHLGVRVAKSRLYWQGGNVLFDGTTLAVGADTIAENVTRLGLAPGEVTAMLAAEFGHEVTVLGDPSSSRFDREHNRMRRSGQASYHLDLDVVLLGRTRADRLTALVADLRAGLAFLPAVLQRRPVPGAPPYLATARGKSLLADEYRLTARLRSPILAAYAEVLVRRGYRVIRVPQLQTRGTQEGPGGLPGQDLAYCNVLPGLSRGRPAVYYLPWGIAPLDAAAAQAFRQAQVRPVSVSRTPYLASAMMDRAAGLRCFCGTLRL